MHRFGVAWPSKARRDREGTAGSHLDHCRRRADQRLTLGLWSVICVGAPVAVASFLFAAWETQPAFMALGAIGRISVLISSLVLIGRAVHQRHAARNETLNAVLNNMAQGLCMFDAEQRLIISNQLYAQIYGLTPQQVMPGTSLQQILEARFDKAGFVNPLTETQLVERLRTAASGEPLIDELSDGRIISISRVPMPRGGWLAVHEDITMRRCAELERDKNRALLDKIVEHVPSAILVRDVRDRRYVLANVLAERLLGAPRDEIIGKTARVFYSAATAARITEDDDDLLRSGSQSDRGVHPYDTPGHGRRPITNTKILIHSDDRKPEFIVNVINDVTERERANARIMHMAHHDALTNLPNRVLFQENLETALAHVRRGGTLAVLYLDLDNFKSINDMFGHSVGDELLKAVAERLRGCVRETDTVARLGGDEFAIVQTEVKGSCDAATLAKRLIGAFKRPYELGVHQIATTVSIGIALSPGDGVLAEDLLKKADMALFGAKAAGRRGYSFFEPEMDARMQRRYALEYSMERALVNDEFELHYQPIVNLQRDTICGLEALVRWRHPERGLVSPAEFIPIAEESGIIIPLGEWVLRRACADAARWPSDIKVAVNLSPVQLMNQKLTLVVISALEESGFPARRLELEITEAVFLKDSEATVETLHRLRALGVQIVMDDFGTGYSSLSYLRSFHFDKIKIDRSFINDLSVKEDAIKIVRAIASLATSLNMRTTAEGVETGQQLDMVRDLGCTEMQGFLFSRPVPCAEVQALLDAGGRAAAATLPAHETCFTLPGLNLPRHR